MGRIHYIAMSGFSGDVVESPREQKRGNWEKVEVANAILYPASGSNSVLQMNMGSGKTSCIVPMTMSVLADGAQLARRGHGSPEM